MVGALAVAALGYGLTKRLLKPLCAEKFASPTRRSVDHRLAVGAVVVGIGWGLVGYCPGPALASLGFGGGKTLLFVAAMLLGMVAFTLIDAVRRPASAD
jgi:uncharacterized membrane protein YedE/YeeE